MTTTTPLDAHKIALPEYVSIRLHSSSKTLRAFSLTQSIANPPSLKKVICDGSLKRFFEKNS